MPKATFAPLWIVPAMLASLGCWIIAYMFPLWSGLRYFDYDCAYMYLSSGLALAEGVLPVHTDNPGTPVQILCALVILLWGKFLGATSLSAQVYADPEAVLVAAAYCILLLNVCACLWMGYALYKASGKLWLACAMQASVFLLGRELVRVCYPSPEALLIALSFLLWGFFAPCVFDGQHNESRRSVQRAFLIGALLGLCLATKITTMPMAALILALGSTRRILAGMFGLLAAFLAATLPIWPRFPEMLAWLLANLTHSGAYGAGERKIFDFAVAANALQRFLENFIWLPPVVVGITWLSFRVSAQRTATRNFVLCWYVMAGGFMLLILKHYETRYLLPLVFAAIFALLTLFSNAGQYFSQRRVFLGLFAAIGLYACAATASFTFDQPELRRERERESAILHDYLAHHAVDARIFWGFRSHHPDYAFLYLAYYYTPQAMRAKALAWLNEHGRVIGGWDNLQSGNIALHPALSDAPDAVTRMLLVCDENPGRIEKKPVGYVPRLVVRLPGHEIWELKKAD